MSVSASAGALSGLRVVELSARAAGSFCTKLLADLGAEVLTVERQRPTSISQVTLAYRNTGKASVHLDGHQRDGHGTDLFHSLLADADVLVDDTDDPLLTTVDLQRLPALVWCSIRPFGLDGPYASFAASHLTIFHSGGEGHLLPSGLGWTLFPERPPIQIGAGVAEHDSGVTAAIAVLAAMRQRDRTGRGQRIDVSDQEAQLTLNRTRLSRFANDGVVMRRTGTPYALGGMLACQDGYVQVIGIRDEHWLRLGETEEGRCFVERPFDSEKTRATDSLGMAALLRDWCSSRPRQRVATLLLAAGVAAGEFAEPAELFDSPQLLHRGFFQPVPLEDGRTVPMPGAPYRFSRTPVALRGAPRFASAKGFTAERRRVASRPVAAPSSPAPQVWSSGAAGEPRDSTPGAGAKAHRLNSASPGPLSGVRILDFTWAAAGPYATLLLALLGADVVKVESSRRPDMARRGFLAMYGGLEKSPNFNELNLNKRSICIDLTEAKGRELVERLVAASDVVVDNFRPGVLARLGFGADRLLAAHPRLIVASSSANGATGPDAAGAGLASIFGATGGLSAQTGYEDGPPSEVGESTDYRSANFLALAILAALDHRDRTGEGQSIDLSSREVVAVLAAEGLLAHVDGTSGTAPLRRGNRHQTMAPHNVYPASGEDEWIAIAVRTDAEWPALCTVLSRPEWIDRYASAASRKQDEDKLDSEIGQWTVTRSAKESFGLLQDAGVAAVPSFTNEQIAGDEHLRARGVFTDVMHPVIGTQQVMRAPWRMYESPCDIRRHGPLLGQDSNEILEEILGLAPEEITKYAEALR